MLSGDTLGGFFRLAICYVRSVEESSVKWVLKVTLI